MALPGLTSSSPRVHSALSSRRPRNSAICPRRKRACGRRGFFSSARFSSTPACLVEVQADQHLCGHQVRGGVLGRDAKRHRQRAARRIDFSGLQVGEAEKIMELDVVACPRPCGLEIRERVGEPPRPVEREAEHLLRFAAFQRPGPEPGDDRRQRVDRLRMIVRVIQRQPSQVGDDRLRGIEVPQPLLGLRDLPRLDQLRGSLPPWPRRGRASGR